MRSYPVPTWGTLYTCTRPSDFGALGPVVQPYRVCRSLAPAAAPGYIVSTPMDDLDERMDMFNILV